MRTTLTLDPDVVALLEKEAHRTRKPFKQVVNQAVRRGLAGRRVPTAPYVLPTHRTGLMPGVDPGALNRLADELEDDALSKRR